MAKNHIRIAVKSTCSAGSPGIRCTRAARTMHSIRICESAPEIGHRVRISQPVAILASYSAYPVMIAHICTAIVERSNFSVANTKYISAIVQGIRDSIQLKENVHWLRHKERHFISTGMDTKS